MTKPSASGSPSNPRRLAAGIVRRVAEEGAYSNVALAAALDRSGLSKRDRQFAAELVYGTLRKLIPLDRAIAGVATRDLGAIDPDALALLRLGAYQLLFLRTPAHASVSETVSLAGRRSKGFVNAVLRKLSTQPLEDVSGEDDGAVSARTGLAPWAVAELRRLLPRDEVEAAAAALASPAGVTLRVNTCRTTVAVLRHTLSSAGYDVVPGSNHPHALHVPSATPSELPGYEEGWFSVQDEASMLVTEAVRPGRGERVLDACAGPGGKASHLACLVGASGAVVASDIHLRRAALVRSTATRMQTSVRVLVQDARRPGLTGPFDAVLVDAPCSGVGAARRRPELLWRPSATDLSRLSRLQVAILGASADLVRPGGRLVYSVCTFPRAETDAAVRAFLAKRRAFEPLDLPGPDGPSPTHRLWPHRHGTDAMFYAGFSHRPTR